ncbi:hypothetical protein [Caudoviricetes sp.]|nr:hypothetical protein [Caudoviricetes sp.]
MSAFLGSQLFSGLAQGLTEGYNENFTPEAQANRANAKLVKAQREEQLRQVRATAPSDSDLATQKENQSQELIRVQQQNQQLFADLAKRRTYDALDRYTGDFDVRHLNSMLVDLKANPVSRSIFGNLVRVDKVTEADAELLKKAGLDPELVFKSPDLLKSLVKNTQADGSVNIADITQLMKATKYTDYATDQELARQKKVAEIQKLYRDHGTTSETERQAIRLVTARGIKPDNPAYNAEVAAEYNKLKQKSTDGGFKTEKERDAFRLAKEEGVDLNTPEGLARYNELYKGIKAESRQTAPSKNMDEVEKVKQAIDDKAAKSGTSFFKEDFSQLATRLKYESQIQRLEKVGGLEFDSTDKKQLTEVRQLIGMGETASGMSKQETGIVDNLFHDVKQYLSNDVSGIDSIAAYAAFRNLSRHAIAGSALTPAEIDSFNQQFGTLKQQQGPVLAHLKQALEQVRSKLEGVAGMGDEHVAYYRLGADSAKLATVIDALDQRIAMIDNKMPVGKDGAVRQTTQRQPIATPSQQALVPPIVPAIAPPMTAPKGVKLDAAARAKLDALAQKHFRGGR